MKEEKKKKKKGEGKRIWVGKCLGKTGSTEGKGMKGRNGEKQEGECDFEGEKQ